LKGKTMSKATMQKALNEARAAYRSLGNITHIYDISESWYVSEWIWNVYGERI
jgi:hypothetical protein